MTSVDEVITLLKEISEDPHATKNTKSKIEGIIKILSAEEELSMRLNKASHELDELASNSDIDSYTRTQLLGVVSALETVDEE
ncbi:UPF0147 family protein [Candidatus Woesearchaeota archaeon]|nr:UPF0147 family protein [Candidatus Woesearchaeota archaeon]